MSLLKSKKITPQLIGIISLTALGAAAIAKNNCSMFSLVFASLGVWVGYLLRN